MRFFENYRYEYCLYIVFTFPPPASLLLPPLSQIHDLFFLITVIYVLSTVFPLRAGCPDLLFPIHQREQRLSHSFPLKWIIAQMPFCQRKTSEQEHSWATCLESAEGTAESPTKLWRQLGTRHHKSPSTWNHVYLHWSQKVWFISLLSLYFLISHWMEFIRVTTKSTIKLSRNQRSSRFTPCEAARIVLQSCAGTHSDDSHFMSCLKLSDVKQETWRERRWLSVRLSLLFCNV